MKREIQTIKRGHLVDLMLFKKPNILTRIATYNCKTNKLTLDNAPNNVLLKEQVFICASLEEIKQEYNEEVNKCLTRQS